MRFRIPMIALTACLASGIDASCHASEQVELNVTASPGNCAGRLARQDYLTPVRPGEPGKSPFWNKNALQFMYVPSFDFPLVASAKYYRFTATTADGSVYRFEASKP
jgi:hypothetical protein